jgi:cytochrome c5
MLYLGYAGAKSGPRPVHLNEHQARGEKVFLDVRCHSCHGINGGGGVVGADLAPDGPRNPEEVATVLRDPTTFNPRTVMPAIPESVTDEEFDALVSFVSAIDPRFHMPLEASAFGPQRPYSHQEENWFANHKFEVRKDPTLCAQCHEPAFCQNCHQKRRPDSHMNGWLKSHFGTAGERPEYCQVCHDQDYCSSCHDTLMHGDDWMKQHEQVKGPEAELCQECHKPDFCITCHGGTRPVSHVPNWVRSHSKASPEDCRQCHNVDSFCVSCHQGARPVSHDEQWMDGHGKSAKADTQACVTCHRQDLCSSCHAGVEMPHASDWMLTHKNSASFQAGSTCFRCHDYGETCSICHGADVPAATSGEDD